MVKGLEMNILRKFWIAIVIGIMALSVIASGVYTVPAGNVGVITRFGAVHRVVQPGLGIKIPFADELHEMSIRTQKDQVDVAAASRDLQVVTSTIATNYHLDGLYATDVFQNVGTNYQEILIAPAVQNIFKATTAKYTAEELITKRDEVRARAEEALALQLAEYHVIVENVNIVNFDFSPEFNAAIEAKQVAQQQVETAKQKLAQAEVDAQTVIAQAQGQADAQAALRDSGSLTDAYLRFLALTKWNGILPTVVGGATPFIDVTDIVQ